MSCSILEIEIFVFLRMELDATCLVMLKAPKPTTQLHDITLQKEMHIYSQQEAHDKLGFKHECHPPQLSCKVSKLR